MKTTSKSAIPDAGFNHVGLLAWSLLAHPPVNMMGGIPGQPDPDTPNEQPNEPGEPTLPDEPPPVPVV